MFGPRRQELKEQGEKGGKKGKQNKQTKAMELVPGRRGSVAWGLPRDHAGLSTVLIFPWSEVGATYRFSPQREGGPGSECEDSSLDSGPGGGGLCLPWGSQLVPPPRTPEVEVVRARSHCRGNCQSLLGGNPLGQGMPQTSSPENWWACGSQRPLYPKECGALPSPRGCGGWRVVGEEGTA